MTSLLDNAPLVMAAGTGMNFLTNRPTPFIMLEEFWLERRAGSAKVGDAMHIPDAVLDPWVAGATTLIGAGGLAYGVWSLREALRDRTPVLMGSMAAFVFAAQMVNFPLLLAPVSGHLLGGVLAAVLLGPWAGALVIGAVLVVQCFLFGDGGLTALGANFINMGLIGSVGGYTIFAPIRREIGGPRGILIGSMVAAWFTVILAAGAFAVELAASTRGGDFGRVLGWMTLVHAAIGLGEALITGMVVRFLLLVRPDLVDGGVWEPGFGPRLSPTGHWLRVGVAGLAIALAVVIFLAPLASGSPDGLEYVGTIRVPFLPGRAETPALPSSSTPLPAAGIAGLIGFHPAVATALAGVGGTLIVFGVAIGLARGFARGADPRSIRRDGAIRESELTDAA